MNQRHAGLFVAPHAVVVRPAVAQRAAHRPGDVVDLLRGALQAAGSVAATELVTLGLKEAFAERRPDGSDRRSFPSGHTSKAFAAAATIYNREGPSIGIPALAVATFVGVARVQADKHFWYDCLAGAAIGTAAGFLITNERPRRVAVVPWGDSQGGGVTVGLRF